ncbi:Uncharacterised protein [Streptococcus pneumoniae]|nr:Uncharacterised protein [Streptococcus pneumoniae]
MTTTKNPWNQLSNVDINGEQAILATEDVELIKKYTSTKHYKNLKDDIYRLQLGFCPQQFVGDIQNADIIVLSKNPGYTPEFKTLYDHDKNYQKTLLNNLQLKGNLYFHAFDLDTNEFGYWAKKFKVWFDDVDNLQDLKEKLPWFSKHVALAEYFPYYSTKYDDKLNDFISKEGYFPTQKFLFNLIRERVLDDNDPVIIIITRSYNKWYDAIPQLKEYKNCYETSNPSNPSLKPENLLKVKRYSAKKEVEKLLEDSLKKLEHK